MCTARLLVTAAPKPWPEFQLHISGTASFHSPKTAATPGKQTSYSLINVSAPELWKSHAIMFREFEETRRWRRHPARQFRVQFLPSYRTVGIGTTPTSAQRPVNTRNEHLH